MPRLFAQIISMIVVVIAGFSLIGCACDGRMRSFDVSVQLDPQLRNQTVLVDLVGVSDPNAEEWDAKSLPEYWRQGDSFRAIQLRDGFVEPMEFVAGSGTMSKTLDRKNEIWARWKREDAINLYVITELQSRRFRKAITLDCGRWDEDLKELEIRITPDGIFQRQSPNVP